MQKVVTIYLSNEIYDSINMKSKRHGCVEEHLEPFLSTGWRVKTLSALGGTDAQGSTNGWVVAVLEQEEAFA